jgi:PAS domain S-box-containing protein
VSVDIFEQMEEGITLHDRDGRFLYLNPTVERLLGQRREAFLGRVWWEVLPALVGQPVQQAFERVARGGAPESLEYFHEKHRRWLNLRFSGVPEGVFAVAHDITARKQAEAERDAVLEREREAREQAEARRDMLEDVFAHAPFQLCLLRGPEHTVMLANPLYRRLLNGRELVGRPVREALPELEGQGLFELLDRVYQTGEPYVGREVPVRLDREGNGRQVEGFYTFVYEPTRGPGGAVDGILGVGFDVTELVEARRRAERLAAELAAGEAEANAVVDTLQEAVVVHDASGQVVKANASAGRLLGLGREGVAGRDSLDTRWDAVRTDGTPFPGSEHPAMVALRTGQVQSEVVMGVRQPDGQRVWLSVNAQPLRGPAGAAVGAVASFTDITQRRRAEEALGFLSESTVALASTLDSRELLETLSRLAVPRFADWCSIYLRQEDGGTALATVSSTRPEVSECVRALHRDHPQPPDAAYLYRRTLRTGEVELIAPITPAMLREASRSEAHGRLLQQLGPRAYLSVPLHHGSRVLGAIVFGLREEGRTYDARDVEVAKELARRAAIAFEQARLFEAVQAERRRAEEASRLKDEFLATVSHELRTPLTAMLGWVQLLRSGRLPGEKQGRALETVERNARMQAQLIEDLLDVSRIVTGKLRLEVGPMELADAVREALEVVRPAAEAKGVRLSAELDAAASPFLGDPQRLRQVVWNLLSNAVKFTPGGGQVDVVLRREGPSAVIQVRDTGRGIAPGFLPHVFERFRQAEGGPTRSFGGLGLGLAIVRLLVELHGGRVEASSEGEGRGATFTVWLPAQHVTMEPVRLEEAAAALAVGEAGPETLEGLPASLAPVTQASSV